MVGNFKGQPGRRIARRRAFSLVEILVVLLILAILISIVVPTLISTQPQRNLAAASERFANDINYCRAKAEATGNNVYMAFEYTPDADNVEGWYDENANSFNLQPSLGSGVNYIQPGNPGVSRSARAYYIVEERPRSKADGSAYTYLDWLNDYDAWNAGNGPYPVEPLFPYSTADTVSSGTLPDPSLGAFNAFAAPLQIFPQHMTSGMSTTTYNDRHFSVWGLAGGDWRAGDSDDQIYKTFCIADEQEILSYDQNINNPAIDRYPPNDPNGSRTYDPVPGGSAGGNPGSNGDHPRLQEAVVDYVLLKRVELPDHVFFINPWQDYFVTGWYDPSGGGARRYVRQDMQFLQYLWAFAPTGEVKLRQWGYEPEPFPAGFVGSLVHGQPVDVTDNYPVARMMWMTLDECLDFGNNGNIITDNKKSQQASSGRLFGLWPLNGKYFVEDYTPNDFNRQINPDDPALDVGNRNDINQGDQGNLPSYQREMAYSQNFLVQP